MLLVVASTAALIQACACGLLLSGAQRAGDLGNFTRELELFSAEVDVELRRQEHEGLRRAGALEEDAGPEGGPPPGAQVPGGEMYRAQRAASLLSSAAVSLAKEMRALKGKIRRGPSELPRPRASVLQLAAAGARQAPGGESSFLPSVAAAASGLQGGLDPFLPPPDARTAAELAASAGAQEAPNSSGTPPSAVGDTTTLLAGPHSSYTEGQEQGLHLAYTVKVVCMTLLVIGAVLFVTGLSGRDARARRQCQWLFIR